MNSKCWLYLRLPLVLADVLGQGEKVNAVGGVIKPVGAIFLGMPEQQIGSAGEPRYSPLNATLAAIRVWVFFPHQVLFEQV